jgi:hypothetical protein
MSKYILSKDRRVIPATEREWLDFWCKRDRERIVRQDDIGRHYVSTVFIGDGNNLFETMIFHPSGDKDAEEGIEYGRSDSWEAAVKLHNEALLTLEGIGGRAVECERCGLA